MPLSVLVGTASTTDLPPSEGSKTDMGHDKYPSEVKDALNGISQISKYAKEIFNFKGTLSSGDAYNKNMALAVILLLKN